ncbi:hypothetical protein [Phyllobacterium myrsinacearum]|uniref:Uncharacterized protein n=1 Tax=Phyllobacterium myrsinacearum TaxID=28101 RepID=A0A839EE51_9HYPH|nr:hypothetical protein [Phyllobacterium myrsinacearum]MBA8878353.1 hypothetical protein [Phyllobacterium myrsinacearum]
MTLAVITIDGVRVDSAERVPSIAAVLERHRNSRRELQWIVRTCTDCVDFGQDNAAFDRRLAVATDAEHHARVAVLRHPANTLEEFAAKTQHICSLLLEDDDSLDKYELFSILQTLIAQPQSECQ